MKRSLKKQLIHLATLPFKPVGIVHYYWGRGKLGGDPIFAALLDEQIFPSDARIIDLGCGRGLLAAWFLAAEKLFLDGGWPADAAPPPTGLRFRGLELMGREAEAGNRALQPIYPGRVSLAQGDLRQADLSQLDVVAILDALHYVNYAEQDVVLDQIRAALVPGGLFLTRVGDAGAGLRFFLSQIVDRSISFVQGHRLPRMWCRPIQEWVRILEARGFEVRTQPMNGANPFANIMLVAKLPGHPGEHTGNPARIG